MQGDTSDNIPGVPGIGEKTALSLIQKYGTIKNLYDLLEKGEAEVKGKQKEKLEQNKELAEMSRFLGTINLEVPIEDTLENLKLEDWNNEEVLKIFKELNFKRYIDRFKLDQTNNENGETESKQNIEELFNIVTIPTKEIIEIIKKQNKIIFNIITQKDNQEDKIIKEKIEAISIYNKEKNEV